MTNISSVKRKIAVCTLSGGLDSAVAAAIMKSQGFELKCIFFDWGQKTFEKEMSCARMLAEHFKSDLKIIEVPILKSLPKISLTQNETLTVAINEYVPNRNAILETQAVAYAETIRAGVVCVGSTGGDLICPDNSLEFISKMQALIKQGTMLKPSILLVAPLVKIDKTEAVKIGKKLGVPFEITWSCHNYTDKACGKCSNCKERIKAFSLNGLKDPITYV